jgi:hypothetical protein
MAPPEVIEIPQKVPAPEKRESDYDFVVDRTFRYTGGNLSSAFTDGAAQGKVLVFFTGSAKMPGIKGFLTKQVPAFLGLPDSKDVLPVYIDLDKLKKDDPILMSLAKKADADSPQILIVNLKPGQDKKPVLDLDSLVTVTAGNQEKSAQLLQKLALLLKAAKQDIVPADKFDLPKAEDKAAKVLPKVDLVDNEESERKAMEGLAKLFVIQQKQREADKAESQKKLTEARRAEVLRVNREEDEIYRKYPCLKDLYEYKRMKWLNEKFPLINHAQWKTAYDAAWENARSVWNSRETNNRLSDAAVSKLYPERDKQWKDLLKLAGEDSPDGYKAYLVVDDIRKKNGYPRWSEDDIKRYSSLAERTVHECTEALGNRCAPGAPNRDLACWLVRRDLIHYPPKWDEGAKLYTAFKDLAKAGGKGDVAPLTKDQLRYAIEDIMSFNVFQGDKGNSSIILACLDDLKTINNPDSLYTLDGTTNIIKVVEVPDWIKKPIYDLQAQLKRTVSDRWEEQVPEPFRKEKERAADLKAALDKYLPKLGDANKSEISDEIVTAIARNYKFYKLTAANTDSIEQLRRALNCSDGASRIAAARVFLSSDLPDDHADRIKAKLTLIELTLDKSSGGRFRREAYALLDEVMPASGTTKIGEYALSKEDDLGLVIEDKKRNWYTVDDEGQLQFHDRVSSFYGFGYSDPARLVLEDNSIKAEYVKGSRVISRTGIFDGDHLKEMTWTETGRFGPFVATRKKEDGKYVDKYTLRIPPTTENGLSTDVEIEGKFLFRRDGLFKYTGEDWVNKSARRLNQVQGIRDTAVRQYTTN